VPGLPGAGCRRPFGGRARWLRPARDALQQRWTALRRRARLQPWWLTTRAAASAAARSARRYAGGGGGSLEAFSSEGAGTRTRNKR
jgi:hypothetical protein